ncbi:MAG: hypothetical protein HY606_15150 [Planctomycetes bacterium]|nr:hypothetical protein [Planctomycetota bacterium]
MKQIISDFFQLGHLRLISRILMALRGLFIISVLTPRDFGEYTIWLLFVFYFQFLDFGTLYALERDIPHFKARQNAQALKHVRDVGWSSFFILSLSASIALGTVTFFVFKSWVTALLLGFHLLTDKLYRAYDSFSRTQLKYRWNGIGEFILAVTSLMMVWYMLPRFGAQYIFLVFILSALITTWFFYKKCPLRFDWYFDLKEYGRTIKGALSLATVYYSYEFFHVIALTVLAWQYDILTLGYFAFAFRIYQICLSIFPAVLADVMRARMYVHSAQLENGEDPFRKMFLPLGLYTVGTGLFCLFTYIGAGWGIQRFFPEYIESTQALILLMLALIPMGPVKVLGEFLCSRVYNKTALVIAAWILGIAFQGLVLFFFIFSLTEANIVHIAPLIYLAAGLLTFAIILWLAFDVRRHNMRTRIPAPKDINYGMV